MTRCCVSSVPGLPNERSQGEYHAAPYACDATPKDDTRKKVAGTGKPFHATPYKADRLDRPGHLIGRSYRGYTFALEQTGSKGRTNMTAIRGLYRTSGVGGLASTARVTNDELTFTLTETVYRTSKIEPSFEELPWEERRDAHKPSKNQAP